MKTWFVNEDSIVRKIWGTADTVLFIFAGAAAEFALNKAVDWLYFTGRLPADPLGRLFSTVAYSCRIIFSEQDAALQAIDQITVIHAGVESARAAKIPDWAYRDVLFLLIDYSIRSFELLDRKLNEAEKAEVFYIFNQVGIRMHLKGLPVNYRDYCIMREAHLQQNLINSEFTVDLYLQYKKHLGKTRYIILKQVQLILVPRPVKTLLPLGNFAWIRLPLLVYKLLRLLKIAARVKNILLPDAYKKQLMEMERL